MLQEVRPGVRLNPGAPSMYRHPGVDRISSLKEPQYIPYSTPHSICFRMAVDSTYFEALTGVTLGLLESQSEYPQTSPVLLDETCLSVTRPHEAVDFAVQRLLFVA